MKIPAEAYTAAIALIGIIVQSVEKWLAAKSGKTIEEVRADIRAELEDTDADLEADRAAEKKRFDG